jgi:hypothetical protein
VKFRITITLILLGIFGSAAHAQANCCTMEVGAPQTSQVTVTVPPAGNNSGGTYISTATQTISIACVNAGSPCSTAVANNVVTANGYGAYSPAASKFVACNPTFVGTSTPGTADQGATFKNVGQGCTTVDSSGNCVVNPGVPSDESQCIVVQCPVNGGGGGQLPPCKGSIKPVQDGGCNSSPIIIDVDGSGFQLTDASNGVRFDISGTGDLIQMGWTAKGASNAFLALPGADGLVDTGKQLFGNFTPQPPSDNPNGFAALAVYDLPANGGNGDGIIDSRDAIYPSLRLWIDANHDGISQPEELHTLSSLGVVSISLNYTLSRRVDQYGNVFRYKAAVDPDDPDPTHVGRTAYDVFFLTSNETARNKSCPAPKEAAQGGSMLSMTGAGNF